MVCEQYFVSVLKQIWCMKWWYSCAFSGFAVIRAKYCQVTKCSGGQAAVLSDLNVQEVIICTKKKRKRLSAYKIKKKGIGVYKKECILGLLYLSSGFCTFCDNRVKLFLFFRKAGNCFLIFNGIRASHMPHRVRSSKKSPHIILSWRYTSTF